MEHKGNFGGNGNILRCDYGDSYNPMNFLKFFKMYILNGFIYYM